MNIQGSNIFTIIGIVVAVIIVVVLVLAARQPAEFRVTRSAVFDAKPEAVFAQVNDLQKWQTWSPWAKMDPDAKVTFDGPISGNEASMAWEGDKTGSGIMTIISSEPYERIQFKLEFIKPMKAINTTVFSFMPQGENQTIVTWTMTGHNNFMAKLINLFMNCEKMVGEQFDDGLNNLRAIVEKK